MSIKFLEYLKKYTGPLDLEVRDNPGGKYETGAWIYAIRNFPNEEKFLLIHDGCLPTSDQWLTQFEERLTPDVGMVSWVKFLPCLFFCFQKHYDYMDQICPHDNVPDGGVFGSIFMAWGSALRDLDSKGYFDLPPSEKIHAEAWERIWAIIFHINGYKIDNIVTGFVAGDIHHGKIPHLRKLFGGRI